MAFDPERPDSDWLLAWMTGRSLARGLPLPFADRGGWRAEIGSDSERRRWVFASLTPALSQLAESITEPGLNLRALASPEAMRAFLPTSWRVEPGSFAMVGPSRNDPPVSLPAGYRLEVQAHSEAAHAFILHANGDLAASGHAGAGERAFVYDRIITQPGHRRLGLGRAIMATLAGARRDTRNPNYWSPPRRDGSSMSRSAGGSCRLMPAQAGLGTALYKSRPFPLPEGPRHRI